MKNLLIAAFVVVAPVLQAQEPVPLGEEFQVNSYTPSVQVQPAVAVGSNGAESLRSSTRTVFSGSADSRELAYLAVNSANDPGDGICNASECTLREAIADAPPGEEIRFAWDLAGSTITLDQAAGPLIIDKDLTINNLMGANELAVSGGDLTTVFHVTGGVVSISGLTIRDGYSDENGLLAGGVLNEGDLTMSECRVTGNTNVAYEVSDPQAGGIMNVGSLILDDCHVSQNHGGSSSQLGAGGITNEGSLMTSNSVVIDNSVWSGAGGITSLEGSSLTMVRSSVVSNQSADGVGGIQTKGIATIADSEIVDNWTGEGAGGLVNNGTLQITGSTIAGNEAYYGTGGIRSWEGTLTMLNCTISDNYGPNDVGGIHHLGGPASIVNSTVTANTGDEADVPRAGGLRANRAGSLVLENTIVAGNNTRGDPYHPNADCAGRLVNSAGHNLVGSGTGCSTIATDLTVSPGDVFIVVLDNILRDNGGPTRTHALHEGSHGIDSAGDTACPETDQRGYTRPWDGDNDQVWACDIGAFEYASDLILFLDGFESGDTSAWSSSVP